MQKVIIYTDGACSGNPGPGGWGAILMAGENKKDIWRKKRYNKQCNGINSSIRSTKTTKIPM